MSLRHINTAELRRLSRICERVHYTLSGEPFPNHLYVVLKDALPSIHFTIDHFTLAPPTLKEAINQSLPSSTFELFSRYIHQHPGFGLYLSANQKTGSLFTELDPSTYRKMELYNEVYRPVNIEDQAWICAGNKEEAIAVSYSRDVAYTEADLLQLSLIQPQINIAWHNWSRTRRLEAQILELENGLIESEKQARIVVAQQNAIQSLTRRQREVVEWVAAGKTNVEIAYKLQISPRTVGKHLEQIFAILNVHTRTALATYTSKRKRSHRP